MLDPLAPLSKLGVKSSARAPERSFDEDAALTGQSEHRLSL